MSVLPRFRAHQRILFWFIGLSNTCLLHLRKFISMCSQEEETKSWKKLINIAVSGAAGMISNHLLFKVRKSRIQGSESSVIYIFVSSFSEIWLSFLFSGFLLVVYHGRLEYATGSQNTSHTLLILSKISLHMSLK